MPDFDAVHDMLTALERDVHTDRIVADAAMAAERLAAREAVTAAREETARVTGDLDALRASLYTAMIRGRIVEVPASIPADGTRDAGKLLTAFLSTVVGPATVRFPAFATYRVDDAAVVVDTPVGVTYDFNGSTLARTRVLDQRLRYPERHGFFRLNRPTDVVVRGLRVKGVVANDGTLEAAADTIINGRAHLFDKRGAARSVDTQAGLLPPYWPTVGDWGVYCQALAFEHGVDISGGRNVVVEDCWLDGMGGDGVGTTLDSTSGVTVRRVTVRRNGRQGISLVAGNGFLVEGCDIRSARAAIDLEPDTDRFAMTNIEVRDCTLASNLLPFASGGPGEIHHVNIHHNTITKGGVPVLSVMSNNNGAWERRDWRFCDNRVIPALSSAQALIRLVNVHGAEIARNTINRRSTEPAGRLTAVLTDRCSGVWVADNVFLRADPVLAEINPVETAVVSGTVV